MRTPEEIIGADNVAALEAAGYYIDTREEVRPRRTTWTDDDGVEHPIEFRSISYQEWRELIGLPALPNRFGRS